MANCRAGDGEQMRRRIAMHLQRPAVAMGLGMQRCSSASEERELTKVLVPVPPEFQSQALIKSRQQVRD